MPLPVLIVGASFAGLSLARRLSQRNVPAIVYQGTADRLQSHGVALHAWAIAPLLELLGLDLETLRQKTSVDGRTGMVGGLRFDAATAEALPPAPSRDSYRAHRPSLLKLLREGVDVRFEKRFVSFDSQGDSVTVTFEDGTTERGCLLVAADGVHSKGELAVPPKAGSHCVSVRAQLLPEASFDILEYAVYYGQQHLEPNDARYALLGESCDMKATTGSTSLGVNINERSAKTLKIGYTYSRPAPRDDTLLQPARKKEAAHDLPPKLLDELRSLSAKTAKPFADLCDVDRQQREGDRIVHWLQRALRIPVETLIESTRQRVALVGDAAHAMPLLTGDGANYALLDGLRLGDAKEIGSRPTEAVEAYYRERVPIWSDGQDEAARQLRTMHEGYVLNRVILIEADLYCSKAGGKL
jgi:2-polyprenyl-6-methoxyphenol hydroxylase-like FAD-dependent oxidoreductase